MKRLIRNRWIVVVGVFLSVLIGGAAPLSARPLQTVDLGYFRGIPLDYSVRLEWETNSEQDVAYFKLERALEEAGPYVYLSDIGQVAPQGSPQSTFRYSVFDHTVATDAMYWYRLVEVQLNNTEVPLALFELFVPPPPPVIPPGMGGGTSTPSPVPIEPTSTDIPSVTPTATSTSTSTPTPSPTISTPVGDPSEPTATATVPPRPAGPTPTAFRFPSPTPFTAPGQPGGIAVAQAAGVLPQTGYPGPSNGITPVPGGSSAYPSGPGAPPLPTQAAYPVPGAPVNGVSNGNSNLQTNPNLAPATVLPPTAASNAPESQTGTATSRVLLWLGFAGGLLILLGGIFFSIALATRRK